MVEPVSYSRISTSVHKNFSHWNLGVLFYFPSLSSCMLAFDSPLPHPPSSLTWASLHYVMPAVAPSGSSAPSFPVSRSLFASLSDLSSAAFLSSMSGAPCHRQGWNQPLPSHSQGAVWSHQMIISFYFHSAYNPSVRLVFFLLWFMLFSHHQPLSHVPLPVNVPQDTNQVIWPCSLTISVQRISVAPAKTLGCIPLFRIYRMPRGTVVVSQVQVLIRMRSVHSVGTGTAVVSDTSIGDTGAPGAAGALMEPFTFHVGVTITPQKLLLI